MTPRYQEEDPNRTISIARSDGDPHRKPNSEGWIQYERDHEKSKRWRGVIGTFLATLSGFGGSDDWHLADWPHGYSLWSKPRQNSRHQDFYLYGRGDGHAYRSSIEPVLHMLHLFSEVERARPGGCRCNLCTGRTQGMVNWQEFRMGRPRSKSGGQPSAGKGPSTGDVYDYETGATSGSDARINEILKHLRQYIDTAAAPPDVDEQRRDQSGNKFRIGEAVWASIPPLPQQGSSFQTKLWPGIVRNHRAANRDQHNPHTLHREGDQAPYEYEVNLLGVELRYATLQESGLLPYQAFALSPTTEAQLPRMNHTNLTTLERRFQPIPYETQATTPPRTSQNALRPFALGYNIAQQLSDYHFATDSWAYSFTGLDGSARPRYQGIWLGPERIWAGDLVRLTPSRVDLQHETWSEELFQPTDGAESRGIVMKPGYFTRDNNSVQVVGTLFEIADKRAGDTAFGLDRLEALPPDQYRFRRITPLDQTLTVPLACLAGRYDYTTIKSPLLSSVLNQTTLDRLPDNPDDESSVQVMRLLSLGSLVPGNKNAIKTKEEWHGSRDELLTDVVTF